MGARPYAPADLVEGVLTIRLPAAQSDTASKLTAPFQVNAIGDLMSLLTFAQADETKTLFIPALVGMLTEVEEDMDTWAEQIDEKDGAVGSTEPHQVAVNAINSLSNDLGEKAVL
jgi:hypothetical protein